MTGKALPNKINPDGFISIFNSKIYVILPHGIWSSSLILDPVQIEESALIIRDSLWKRDDYRILETMTRLWSAGHPKLSLN